MVQKHDSYLIGETPCSIGECMGKHWRVFKEEKGLSLLWQHVQAEHNGSVNSIEYKVLTHRTDTTLRETRDATHSK